MQKNDKFYTFLLSHSNKNKISIRRVEVSKKLLHSTVAGVFLVGIFTIVFTTFFNKHIFAKSEFNPINQVTARSAILIKPEYKQINYDRPAESENYTVGSGGPLQQFDLLETESGDEIKQMETQLRLIEATSNPSFLPTMWAHLGKINNEFGYRRNPFGGRGYEFHPGMDIDGERGDTVAAPANGIVSKAGWEGGYGNMIEIDHGNGLFTRYGHLSKIETQIGETIVRGQEIGLIGSTGRSTGPHLHFEIRINDTPINPRRFLPPEPAEIKVLNNR